MRRALMTVCCGLSFLAMTPSPAHAWWDFIEQLSGPGPFWAVDVQFRVFCWVRDPSPGAAATGEFQVNSGGGVVLSACKIPSGRVRRAALDLGTAFGWTGHDQQFAGGERIRLWTIGGSYTYNVFSAHPNRDFLDIAAGGGGYVFSSKGMPQSVSGYYLEPVRFEFHPTTNFKRRTQSNGWSKLVPVLRVGYLLFPSGFETEQFVDTTPKHIGADWVFTAGLFFNFEIAQP
jgi:hypothetical protein